MAAQKITSNQYYVHLPGEEPIEWDIHKTLTSSEAVRPDCVYWGNALKAMENTLEISGLTYYLTWDTQSLPSYGDNVVAVVMGDERCCIPAYFNQVKAIFKCYGIRPILGCNPFLKPSHLNFITLLHFFKNWTGNLSGLLQYKLHQIKSRFAGSRLSAPIYEIPLGYYNQLELPIKPLERRSKDVFFAGSVKHSSFLSNMLDSPKSLSRKRMIYYLQKFKDNNPDFKIQLDLMPSFLDAKTVDDSNALSYSQRMMDSKICLIPRGASFETFRFFEALRYGCIIITEALPRHWFYQGCPAIHIQEWDQLQTILETLLRDSELLHAKHQESLDW